MKLPELLKSLKFANIFGSQFIDSEFAAIDLSSNNPDSEKLDLTSAESMNDFVKKATLIKNVNYGFGGYIEKRGWYIRNSNFTEAGNERIYHLGIDVWVPAGTLIHAPFGGTIHSLRDNAFVGDYGPTIILSHTCSGHKFHTLYGHLSRECLKSLKPGSTIDQGSIFASIGDEEENGNWPAHLHFQIIADMQDKTGDYPGVSSKADLEFMQINCPDPYLILEHSLLR